nr:hypothetical protein [Streptomyces bingchenggensis]
MSLVDQGDLLGGGGGLTQEGLRDVRRVHLAGRRVPGVQHQGAVGLGDELHFPRGAVPAVDDLAEHGFPRAGQPLCGGRGVHVGVEVQPPGDLGAADVDGQQQLRLAVTRDQRDAFHIQPGQPGVCAQVVDGQHGREGRTATGDHPHAGPQLLQGLSLMLQAGEERFLNLPDVLLQACFSLRRAAEEHHVRKQPHHLVEFGASPVDSRIGDDDIIGAEEVLKRQRVSGQQHREGGHPPAFDELDEIRPKGQRAGGVANGRIIAVRVLARCGCEYVHAGQIFPPEVGVFLLFGEICPLLLLADVREIGRLANRCSRPEAAVEGIGIGLA